MTLRLPSSARNNRSSSTEVYSSIHLPGRARAFRRFAFFLLAVMTQSYARYRHDVVFLQEHFDTEANCYYFNSSSRLERNWRSGSCWVRASAFSYDARASAVLPSLRHISARAECAR